MLIESFHLPVFTRECCPFKQKGAIVGFIGDYGAKEEILSGLLIQVVLGILPDFTAIDPATDSIGILFLYESRQDELLSSGPKDHHEVNLLSLDLEAVATTSEVTV
ncbi:hypothetical protein WAI453_005714 [Rhynchosporium graminicola]